MATKSAKKGKRSAIGRPIEGLILVETSSLHPSKRNANRHSPDQIQAISRSLERYGQTKPIIIRPDGEIVAGEGTWKAAASLGWPDIRAIVAPLEDDDAIAYGIADNALNRASQWDRSELRAMVVDLDGMGFDGFDSFGFSANELTKLRYDPGERERAERASRLVHKCPGCGMEFTSPRKRKKDTDQ